MKTLLIGINAKYIHPNLAIRLLKKNTQYETDIIEFTIKDSINSIIDYIFSKHYDTIAFSCYIWNIEYIKQIMNSTKDKGLTVILGGPEVSYNAEYYIKNGLAQYVIKNEGEEAFDLLLSYLDHKTEISQIPNLYHKNGYTFDKLVDLSKSKMAYDLFDDVENKIMYIETSRGCPYHCGYCMASLDNKVRFFDIEEIKKQILILIERNARVFKFLDRTFNANKKNFISLIDFIILNHKPNTSFQFEITGDLLSTDIIDYINSKAPKNLFRFEIGIQSTNIKTNLSVGRIQDNEKLFHNIHRIQDAQVIDLHLDLIAGLPYEDYASFENTFNEVVSLRPKELQLGFLKLLYGTSLMNNAKEYNYVWSKTAPYEIIENEYMSKDDIAKIHIAEDAFESYYNAGYMPNTMSFILDHEKSPFAFFENLGRLDFKRKGLEHLFSTINTFVKTKPYYNEIHRLLILDYLSYFSVKPMVWWEEDLDKKTKNEIKRMLLEQRLVDIPLLDLYKYCMLIELKDIYILAEYKKDEKRILQIEKNKVHSL